MAAVAAVRSGGVQRRLLRRAGASVLARPTGGGSGDPGPRGFRGGRQDLPVLRALPLAGAHAVDALRRSVRRPVGARVDVDRGGGALPVVGASGSRRPCGDPVGDAHESGRRPLGAGALHRGGRVLPGTVRRRLDLGLQRDRVVGTDPRSDRLRPDRRVGRIRVRRSPAAAGRFGRSLGRHTDSRADRARCLDCAHRLRRRAAVAQSDHRLRSRSLGAARRAAPDRRPCRRQLREVRHLDLGAR